METVQSILERKGSRVDTIGRTATVGEAVDVMCSRKIGALVVADGDKVVGIFTERDVLSRVVAARSNPNDVKVGDVMTSTTTCCRPDTTMAECRAVMNDKNIRHLPVVADGKLCGIVGLRDIVAAESIAKQDTIKCLESTIENLNEYYCSIT